MTRVRVHWTPLAAAATDRDDAVVVDVLRATTTLCYARRAGAARILPVRTPEAAFALRAQRPEARIAGERGGRRVAGFDLGNAPEGMTAEAVSGRDLIFASTNGSRALLAASGARRRWLGAFVCASAVREALRAAESVVIVCAGSAGSFSLEDAAFAGWLVDALARDGAWLEGPEARLARTLAPRNAAEVRAWVRESEHGRALAALGREFRRDVEVCGTLDAIDRAYVA